VGGGGGKRKRVRCIKTMRKKGGYGGGLRWENGYASEGRKRGGWRGVSIGRK